MANKVRKRIIAQSCVSKECKTKFKEDMSDISQTITTPHEVNFTAKKITCLYCKKKSKF